MEPAWFGGYRAALMAGAPLSFGQVMVDGGLKQLVMVTGVGCRWLEWRSSVGSGVDALSWLLL